MEAPAELVGELTRHTVVNFWREGAAEVLIEHGFDQLRASALTKRLPKDFPIVVDDGTGLPIRSVLLHLLEQHRRPKRKMVGPRSLNSARAAAYDLCQLFDHFEAIAFDLDQAVDQDVIDRFARAQSLGASDWTGEPLATSTISRRVASVAAYCRSKPFKAIGSAQFDTKQVPAYGVDRASEIHPLTSADWQKLIAELGPMPSRARKGTITVRRLVAEWCLWTAARRSEVVNLVLKQVEDLEAALEHASDDEIRRIELTITKGRIRRRIAVPVGLLRETIAYIRSERLCAMEEAGDFKTSRLFLLPPSSRRSGHPVTAETASRWFKKAVRSARLKRRDLSTGGATLSNRDFVLHDLRHTAAVWMYIAFTEAGVEKPWKQVQSRLGHLRLETTEKIYLEFVDHEEAGVSDLLASEYTKWMAA